MRYIFLLAIIAIAVSSILGNRVMRREAHNVDARTAADLYAKTCASCHGQDGRAKTFKARLNHARNLTDETWQGNVSDERIFNSIMNGKGKMPANGKKMSEQEIDSLVAYVRRLKK